eukprot:CAMPEP_0194041454 /NCGR_PEP_ID=MMETSP0009_2-20130614/13360_1 /TAXON_ID=210454 /ORGANISM="Grammatophora oceanica, Strain CCMP 410" /LENGTH=97 /DNA_ID=CAMNT_0038684969 /DNA_START=389 /DNA_END=683 /DNA_ORIENTATION=-
MAPMCDPRGCARAFLLVGSDSRAKGQNTFVHTCGSSRTLGMSTVAGGDEEVEWSPVDTYREAADNLKEDVMRYVEKNATADEVSRMQSIYGEGMAWR